MTTLGTLLLVVGTATVGASVLVNAANGWPADGGVRRVGRVVLRAFGVVTRAPCWPFRAYYRYLTEHDDVRCARLGHRPRWDGHAERCAHCGVDSYPGVDLPDPGRRPARVQLDLDVTQLRPALRPSVRPIVDSLAADAERLREDARRLREDVDRVRPRRRYPPPSSPRR